MLTRRRWITFVSLAGLSGLAAPRRARAATIVHAPNYSLGAIVAAAGLDLVGVEIDPGLADDQIVIAGAPPVSIGQRVLRKGEGVASGRYLDDARNATKVGANIKTALTAALPKLATELDANHVAWAKPFAKQALAWTKELGQLELARVRDEHGRVYLLEWAGATIDPAGEPSPAGLANAPEQPTAPTLAAYRGYVSDLIAALR